MWQTYGGIRKLDGAERRFFLESVLDLRGSLHSSPELDDVFNQGTKVEIFERMTCAEKLYALFYVTSSLLDDTTPLAHLAWMDASIYAVFQWAKLKIQEEIATNDKKNMFWRKALAKIFRRRRIFRREWNGLVEEASYLILTDLDFENEQHFLDMEPAIAEKHYEGLGLDSAYYSTPLPYINQNTAKQSDTAILAMVGLHQLAS